MSLLYLYHHYDDVAPPARISVTLFRHPSLSSISPRRSSRLHLELAQSCCIYFLYMIRQNLAQCFQWRYYVHFRTNFLVKTVEPHTLRLGVR